MAEPPVSPVTALPESLRLTGLAELDRQWFRLRPDRRYRCRPAARAEQEAFGAGDDLVILIRHLGEGALVYQPVLLAAPLPANEREIAALFALASDDPRPVPSFEGAVWKLSMPAPRTLKLPAIEAFGLALAVWALILAAVIAFRAW